MLKNKFLGLTLLFVLSSQTWSNDITDAIEAYNNLDDYQRVEFKNKLSKLGWRNSSNSNTEAYYLHFDYVVPISSSITRAWLKGVITNDIVKDGLTVNDYTMYQHEFNCDSKTSKLLSYTEYNHKTGAVIDSYNPTYPTAKTVIPETIGESNLESACLYNYMKKN